MTKISGLRQNLCILLALAGFTFLIYWPATTFDFTNYDDPEYVTSNPIVQNGLTWTGISWAFKSNWASNWHPFTWISHMLDCSLFGLKPGWHHFTNILWHTTNSALLFLVLWRLTKARWRSALVAALFAWHPFHVESAAWISERKDLLCAFFWFLAMWAYGDYAGKSQRQLRLISRRVAYGFTFILVAAALLSKPMAVTLPFVFMLMDVWPLRRESWSQTGLASSLGQTGPDAPRQISLFESIFEKIPFFGLAILDCVVTFWAQKNWNSVVSVSSLPFQTRAANAAVSYVAYLFKLFWPIRLAVHYPYPDDRSFFQIVMAVLILIAITVFVFSQRRQRSHLLIGWLFFLGTLVPAIGLVQVGSQFMADRYMYLPAIGIFIMLAWSLPGKWFCWPRPGLIGVCGTGALLISLMTLTEMQLRYWRDSLSLFSHAVSVSPDDALAEYNLGEALTRANQWDAAIPHFETVLAMRPNRVDANHDCRGEAHFNLGLIYRAEKKWQLAEEQFRGFMQWQPQAAKGHLNLGATLVAQDHPKEALVEFRFGESQDGRDSDQTEVMALADLDSAYDEAGMPDKALLAAQETLAKAKASNKQSLIEDVLHRMKIYSQETTNRNHGPEGLKK